MSPESSSSTNQPSTYGTSPLWSDLTPIPLQDQSSPSSAAPLATIAYSPRYAEAMSYLRALMAANEHSERALTLTADIIAINPAHYTVWLYRAATLKALGAGSDASVAPTSPSGSGAVGGYKRRLLAELEWLGTASSDREEEAAATGGVCARNLKNYQVWHHRQTMVEALGAVPAREREFVTQILALDAKNYHVWTYRLWLCRRFPEWVTASSAGGSGSGSGKGGKGGELESIEDMIDEDVRNNSAWSHRFFLVFGIPSAQASAPSSGGTSAEILDEDTIDCEVAYTSTKINLAPQNASAWNYLRGVLRRSGRDITSMRSFCEGFVDVPDSLLSVDAVRSSHALDWLAEIYAREGEGEKAVECLDALGGRWDPIRRNYWEYRKRGVVV